MIIRILAIWCLLIGIAFAQPNPYTNLSTGTVVPTGGNTPTTLGAGLSRIYAPRDFGAVGNAQQATLTVSVSGVNMTVSAATFSASDVGKSIVINGAGTGGAPFVTTITGFTNSTHITLGSSVLTTLSSTPEWITWGTDDATALTNCVATAAANYGACYLQTTKYYVGSNITIPQYSALIGPTYPEQIWANGGAVISQVPELIMAPGNKLIIAGKLSGVFEAAAATQTTCSTAQCLLQQIAGYSGTGILSAGSAQIEQVAILGFALGIDTNGSYHMHLHDITIDCTIGMDNHDSGDWNFGDNIMVQGIIGGNSGTGPIITTVSGAANNGSGLVRLTVASTNGLATGNSTVVVQSVGGVPAANGRWTITVIDGTHVDLQGSTFSGTYTSGGQLALKISRPGPAFEFLGTGGEWSNITTYGWDVGLYLGDGPGSGTLGATWVQITGFAADNLNVADPTTIGIDIEGHSFGSHIQVSYVIGWYPVKINTTTGSSENNSPHIIEGGMLYTASCGTPTPKGIWIEAGNAIFVGDQAPCNTIIVGTGATAIFSAVRGDGGTSFASGSDLSNTIISGSLFGDVTGTSLRGGGVSIESWNGSNYVPGLVEDTSGNVTVGNSTAAINLNNSAGLAANATTGFVGLPYQNGAPTGAPTAPTACAIDYANGYLNCYFAGAWHKIAFSGGSG